MRSMVVKASALIALAAPLCFGAVAATAAKQVESKVKITEGGPSHFEGKVTSDKRKCIKKRDVALKYASGARKGQVAYETKTDRNGLWEIDAAFNAGLYQAVLQRVVFERFVCLRAKSLRQQF